MSHTIELTTEDMVLLDEVKAGLASPQKELPCKLLYDEQGSFLFDKICDLEEYYPTRTEVSIMDQYANEMTNYIGEGTLLIEYGSGSSVKIRSLLDALKNPSGYIAIDISKEHLEKSVACLRNLYPHILINSICADYTKSFSLPNVAREQKKVIYFPGSTIGNFHPKEVIKFLSGIAGICGLDGGMLIGVDLVKSHSILNAAYNDNEGVTAEFNKNILKHLNNRFNVNLNPDYFKHKAFFNRDKSRVEMHLVCQEDISFQIDGRYFNLDEGETIWTESSYKYSLSSFEHLANQAGLKVKKIWTDPKQYFSVQYLSFT